MPLCFFADHCVPRSVAEALQSKGHEILLLRDHLPTDAPDPVVIEKTQELGALLLSLNGDFADIVSCAPDQDSHVRRQITVVDPKFRTAV